MRDRIAHAGRVKPKGRVRPYGRAPMARRWRDDTLCMIGRLRRAMVEGAVSQCDGCDNFSSELRLYFLILMRPRIPALHHGLGPTKGLLPAVLMSTVCAMAPDPAQAQARFLRNGMPCVEELCVGEDASRLATINWTPAVDPISGRRLTGARVSQAAVLRLQAVVKAEPSTSSVLAPYWHFRVLDGQSIPLLAGRAVCQAFGVSDRLHAEYVDGAGLKTVVGFEPRSPSPTAPPTFMVVSITQFVPVQSPSHANAIGRQVRARYGPLNFYASESEPAAAWVPDAAMGPHLRLLAPTGTRESTDANLTGRDECSAGQTGSKAPIDAP